MKTMSAKPLEVVRRWYLVDANGKTLGRLASAIAYRLRGKNKPDYTPHVDMADFFVVVNAEKVAVTGQKETEKVYYRHTGTSGGLKSRTLEKQRAYCPEDILRIAVKGMLPKGPLGRQIIKKLKIYAGNEHPHLAQSPESIEL